MKKVVMTMLTAALFAAAGCALMGPEYVEPAEYDLAQPPSEEIAPLPVPVRFGVFRNVSGADRRFLVREENDRMLTDEYNRWLVSPELLIERRLRAAMPDPEEVRGNSEVVRLSGTVYRFEFDRRRKRAVVGVNYSARLSDGGRLERDAYYEVPMRDDSPATAVQAMSAAVEKSAAAARMLVQELLKEAGEKAPAPETNETKTK